MQVEVKEKFEIKKMSSYKVGGIFNKVYLPTNKEELVYLLNTLDQYILLGNCTNVILSSTGYKGNLILTTQMKDFRINGTHITASCGLKGQLLSQKTCELSLTGFEFMIGFPGTIGGEIYMNASAHGQCISDNLIKCCLFDNETKKIIYKKKSEMGFEYRTSMLQKSKRFILIEAEFNLQKEKQEVIQKKLDGNLAFRKAVQPTLATPNGGSVFRNPENNSAGKLLDSVGAKQFESENLRIWDKHANFIINKGNATSTEILEMMVKMHNAVQEKYGIELEPENIFIGDKNSKEEELCKILYKKSQK